MKKFLALFFVAILVYQSVNSQSRSNIWQMGQITFNNFPKFQIDFSSGNPDTSSLVRPMPFFVNNSSICDTNGMLLFYTNGIYVANSNHDTLQNGNDFNPGWETNDNSLGGSSTPQGSIIIPKPGSQTNYLIFHVSGEQFTSHSLLQIQPLYLSYSKVDMTLDNGLGGILQNKKNVHLIEDTLVHGRITACKHANGRDWWIVVARFYSNLYYKILVTPDTIYSPYSTQSIGDTIEYDALGQAVFSPDGTKYAMIGANSNIDFFHFDRCSGDFTSPEHIYLAQGANGIFGGAFSPNSRYLYANNYDYIFQFDTDSFPLDSSRITVATWVPHNAPFPTEFFMQQLAPDGKIYINTYGGDSVLHVINYPDSAGLACNVTQNSFIAPNFNSTIPNFPNYNLGADSGSVCDTLMLSIKNEIFKNEISTISVFPNPAQNYFYVNNTNLSNRLVDFFLYNSFGKEVMRMNLSGTPKTLLIQSTEIKNGIYFWKCDNQNGKIVIIK